MGTREEYTACMKPYMTGGGPDRKERFCHGAKICSGKAKNKDEAARLCAEAAANPKPAKEKRGRKVCSLKDLDAISVCLVENIDISKLTTENMTNIFGNALKKCSGVKVAKRITSAQLMLAEMDPQQIKALETIAKLSQEGEVRKW